ncbi:MAG TPA: thiamine pyrophosphate-dependent enzyme, partial [Acidimicrobiales bacterium]
PHPDDVAEVTALVDDARRGVLVAGWGAGLTAESVHRVARAAGWPVLADAASGRRAGPTAVSTYDPLLRSSEFAASMVPDMVIHVGAPLTNKPASRWLDGVPRVIVDPDGAWLDPNRSAGRRVAADPDLLLRAVTDDICWRGPRAPWLERWLEAESVARRTVDGLLDSWDEPFEGRVVRDVARALPEGAAIVVGSSMPVRDAESFVAPREGVRWLCNRGVNGIDGFVSTVLGVARVHGDGAVVGLLGDLTLLHDVGGLLWATDHGLDATLVVLDNEGGGIFSFLPQAGLPEHFETLFGTPHGLDLAAVASAYGVPAVRVATAEEVVPAVDEAVDAGGVRIVIVPTDRAANVARHREVWAAVASAIAR